MRAVSSMSPEVVIRLATVASPCVVAIVKISVAFILIYFVQCREFLQDCLDLCYLGGHTV